MDDLDLIVDPGCARALGQYGVPAVAEALHRGACPTCQQPVGQRERLALRVDAFDTFAYATVHHPACQQPGWRRDGDHDMLASLHSTYSIMYFVAPVWGVDMTLAMVNPNLEVVLLLPQDDGGYYPELHPQFRDAGMVRNSRVLAPPLISGIGFLLNSQGVPTLRMPSGAVCPHDEACPADPEVERLVRDQQKLVFVITQAINPQLIPSFDDDLMRAVLDHRLTRVAMVGPA